MKIIIAILFQLFLVSSGYSQSLKEFYASIKKSYDTELYSIGYKKADSLININSNDSFAYFLRAYCYLRTPSQDSISYIHINTPYRTDSIQQVYLSKFDTVQYLNDLNKSISIDKSLSESYLEKSSFLRFTDSKQSLDDISKFIILNPKSLEGFYARALIYEDLKLFDLAIENSSCS